MQMVVKILRDCTTTAVIVTCQACFVQQTYLWWMYLLLSSLFLLVFRETTSRLCAWCALPVPTRVPTTNEKWVGTCPHVPYGFGAYGLVTFLSNTTKCSWKPTLSHTIAHPMGVTPLEFHGLWSAEKLLSLGYYAAMIAWYQRVTNGWTDGKMARTAASARSAQLCYGDVQ